MNQCIKIVNTNFKIIGFLENLRLPGLMFNSEDALHGYWQGKGECFFTGVKLDDDVMLPESKCGVLYEYLIEGILAEVPMD